MGSYLHQGVIDFASVSSIFGLIITIFVLYYTKSIKNSFLRRARLPEINRELERNISDVASAIKNFDNDKNQLLEAFAKSKGLLQNLQSKLPGPEKTQIKEFLSILQPKKYFFIKSSLSEITPDKGWELYGELNVIFVRLKQLSKDSRWN